MINEVDIPVADNESQPQDDHNTEQTPEMFDSYIDMEFTIPRGLDGGLFHAKVKQRAMVCDGDPIREEINKPTTDTSLYKVEYIYRTIETLAANIITENILLQVEKEGHRKLLMNVIIDNQTHKDDIKEDDTFYTTRNGTRHH